MARASPAKHENWIIFKVKPYNLEHIMKKTYVNPDSFTKILGKYSHCIKVDIGDTHLIFVSGQIALDSGGNPVSDDIEEQTRFVFENIKRILSLCHSSFDDVVKAQIFLTNIEDYAKVSNIRNQYFSRSKPTSTLVEVSSLVHKACKIEVEVIAIAGAGTQGAV